MPKDAQRSSSRTKKSVNKMKGFLRLLGDDLRVVLGVEDIELEAAEDEQSNSSELPLEENDAKAAEVKQNEEQIEAEIAGLRQDVGLALAQKEQNKEFLEQKITEAFQRIEHLLQSLEEKENEALIAVETESDSVSVKDEDDQEETQVYKQPIGPQANYRFPTVDLLNELEQKKIEFVEPQQLEEQQERLQVVLDSFAVDAQVCDAIVGPRVTQYRVRPGVGVRVESISSLDKNISLGMAARSVRVQAPIPGESFVGVELPNHNSVPIFLRSILASKAWHKTQAEIPLVLGMDINGRMLVTDLVKAPHLLIAGATGSGKSVCMNNIIMSLLYRFKPEELELCLVDPKKVEFSLYRNIPHLIHPVVTEAKMVVGLLKWLVQEMEDRYDLLSKKQVRNITSYNKKAKAEGFKPLPLMVVIIDELADLMLTARNEVEASLARLAQLSRAAGIHTIIATQRPSVNILTGVIKANYPTRIAFRVSSQFDSRTILDTKGAESLLGQGDMLFNPPGFSRLFRIQGPMVEDDEIKRVVDFVSKNRNPMFRVEIKEEDEAKLDEIELEEGIDPLFKEALQVVVQNQRATTSFIQRRLKIGYNRAANLIEEMEVRGYVGPQVGVNPREILVGMEEL